MGHKVTETVQVDEKKTRENIYNLEGPELATVESFWEYLKERGEVVSYKIEQS